MLTLHVSWRFFFFISGPPYHRVLYCNAAKQESSANYYPWITHTNRITHTNINLTSVNANSKQCGIVATAQRSCDDSGTNKATAKFRSTG
jgi:hypothetical protein